MGSSNEMFEFYKTVSNQYEHVVNFMIKANDHVYLHLDRVQCDLAHTNRNMTYWGYLIGNLFMINSCFGLSMDVIQWIVNSPIISFQGGDAWQVKKWFQFSMTKDQINYEVRNCKMRNHIDAVSVFSREIDPNSTTVVHYLKKDDQFMKAHYTLVKTYAK